jgi:hypothetical protein
MHTRAAPFAPTGRVVDALIRRSRLIPPVEHRRGTTDATPEQTSIDLVPAIQ